MSGFFKRAILLIPFFFLVFSPPAFAVTEDECRQRQQKDVDDGIACWQQLLSEVGQKKATLQSEIVKFNTSISLTLAKIDQTAKQIKTLETEIVGLTAQITKLDVSLNQLSQILIKRIAATYKKGKVEPLSLLFSSVDFSEFVARYKYLRVMQIHDRQLMVQTEGVRTNYEDQKTLKQQKQDELGAAKKKLESQRVLLAQQKADKENLLAITHNDEKRYQSLLSTAYAQLASLKGFTSRQGGGILPPQESPDGWFYSQRDERWASKLIGYSSENIFDVGCLVSSVAMLFTHYGQKTTPLDIANNTAYFFAQTAYLNQPWPAPSGKSYVVVNGRAAMDEELNAGRPVIVHLALGGDGHFVVLKKKDGDDYVMHDPWQGYDKKLKDFYSVSAIDKIVVYK